MNKKRWIAILIATIVLASSITLNMVLSFFTSDFLGDLDSTLMPQDEELATVVVESGSKQKRIAYLTVDGVIQDLGTTSVWETIGYDHQGFLQQLEAIVTDKTVAGIVLKVNSPGGGVMESAEIYDKLLEIKEKRNIPIYVSMGSMAASGGYYIAAPATKIFAHQETITGSIGVIMQSLNYKKLADNIGVKYETFKSGAHKDMLSPTRDVTKEERAMLQEMIDESYEQFVDIIEVGRRMSEADVKKVADGRILSGSQAMRAGLVDGLANTEDTILQLRKDYDLQDAELFEYQLGMQDWQSLLGVKISSLFGLSSEEKMLMKLMTDYNAPKMMYLYGE